LAAQYGNSRVRARSADIEETLTRLPASIARANSWQVRNTPVSWTSSTRFHSSSSKSGNADRAAVPAELTRTSIPPNASSVRSRSFPAVAAPSRVARSASVSCLMVT
jgi:hypothetical protein